MVRKMLWAVAAVFGSLLLLGGAAGAQDTTTTEYGPQPGPQVDDSSVLAGDVVNITGNCDPNADVTVSLQGEVLATTTTDGAGDFSVAVQIPSDLAPGTYTLQVRCGDDVFDVVIEVLADGTVNPPPGSSGGGTGPLSRTGTDLSTPVAIGVGLVALGGVALALTANRRRRTA